MKVIFYNDDFGLSTGFTNAIADSIKKGITTSSCVRTNGTAFNYSYKVLHNKKLKKYITGIHFNLTDGPTENKSLSASNGNFKYSYFNYLIPSNTLLREIRKEFILQLEKALKAGYEIDHINSQEHVHMIPAIFKLTCQIANEYKIKKIRITNEKFYIANNIETDKYLFTTPNFPKHLLLNSFALNNKRVAKKHDLIFPDAFCGVLFTNHMTQEAIMSGLLCALSTKVKTLEILGHPAYGIEDKKWTSKDIQKYVLSKERKIETNTFLDKERVIKNFLKTKKIKSIAYSDFNL